MVEWQVLVRVFTSLIVWLEVSTFIKVYELHSLTGVVKTHKCIPEQEDDKRDKYAIMIDCSNIRKGDANIKRDIENKLMFGTILRFINFNNFGTWRLNGPWHLFYSFCCTTRCIFEPLRVFEPGFNTDKYGICVEVVVVYSIFRLRMRL